MTKASTIMKNPFPDYLNRKDLSSAIVWKVTGTYYHRIIKGTETREFSCMVLSHDYFGSDVLDQVMYTKFSSESSNWNKWSVQIRSMECLGFAQRRTPEVEKDTPDTVSISIPTHIE